MKARLIESHELCPDVRHFVFEALDVERFTFVPGQFVSFEQAFDGKLITRAYSLASAPNGPRFELCLNRVEDGLLSPHLFAMHRGDTVEMTGPLGYFTLRNPNYDKIFVATGTGIAPFRSILQHYLSNGGSREVHLLFGVRYEGHLMYRDEFEQMALAHPNFRFWPTLSRPGTQWTGRTGHVQQHLLEALGDRRDTEVYICGLKLMVDDVRHILKGLGFDRKQIIYEKYD